MIYTEERKITVDISKEVDRIALDEFIRKVKDEGFSHPKVVLATIAQTSLITVFVTKKEESQ